MFVYAEYHIDSLDHFVNREYSWSWVQFLIFLTVRLQPLSHVLADAVRILPVKFCFWSIVVITSDGTEESLELFQ